MDGWIVCCYRVNVCYRVVMRRRVLFVLPAAIPHQAVGIARLLRPYISTALNEPYRDEAGLNHVSPSRG